MRKHLVSLALAATLAIVSVAEPSVAHAEHQIGTPFTGTRPFQLDFHAGLTWYGEGGLGLVTGVRFGIPLMHNGFISSIDNAVYLNFGGDFYYGDAFVDGRGRHYYHAGFGFPVTLHWEFYFSDMWSVFGELGFQIYFPPAYVRDGSQGYYADAGGWIAAAAGGTLHFNEVIGLTLRVGNPYIAAGITFYF